MSTPTIRSTPAVEFNKMLETRNPDFDALMTMMQTCQTTIRFDAKALLNAMALHDIPEGFDQCVTDEVLNGSMLDALKEHNYVSVEIDLQHIEKLKDDVFEAFHNHYSNLSLSMRHKIQQLHPDKENIN